MAQISNGNDSMRFMDSCSDCILGQEPCPVAWVVIEYSSFADNKKVKEIIDCFVNKDFGCEVHKLMKQKEVYKNIKFNLTNDAIKKDYESDILNYLRENKYKIFKDQT